MTSIDSIIRFERSFFLAIARASDSKELRLKLIQKCTQKQVKAFSLVALNVLYGSLGISNEKKKVLQSMKPFLRSVSDESIGVRTRKQIMLAHIPQVFTFVQTVFKNLDDLIWRDPEYMKRTGEE